MLFVTVHADRSAPSDMAARLAPAIPSRSSSSISSRPAARSPSRLLKLRRLRMGGAASRATRRSLRPAAAAGSTATSARPQGLYCGDKLITQGEVCDDGNGVSNDGCSATCRLEQGFTCYALPSICVSRCGDGVVATNEKCDDGNTSNADGCSAACRIEIGFRCAGSPSDCDPIPVCGNFYVEGDEQCDDGNTTDFDGCSGLCKTE